MKKIAFFMCCLCAVMFMSCTKTTGTENGHEWVDLGLPSGTKWATCNVGSSKPEDYGNYYAWGETETKTTYNESTYKWCKSKRRSQSLTKYCTDRRYGTVDNKTVLDLEDDAARANWGGQWRMPTNDEWDELWNNCEWKYTTRRGVSGCEFRGSNGNSIFLPEAGYRDDDDLDDGGYYWSSDYLNPWNNFGYMFDLCNGPGDNYSRCSGLPIRPVFK